MSLLNRAKRAAMENLSLAAQAAVDGSAHIKNRTVEAVGDVADSVQMAIESRKLEDLPKTLDYLMDNDQARLLLADAIASAESAASDDTTWDQILKAAVLDLKSTPVGSAA